MFCNGLILLGVNIIGITGPLAVMLDLFFRDA